MKFLVFTSTRCHWKEWRFEEQYFGTIGELFFFDTRKTLRKQAVTSKLSGMSYSPFFPRLALGNLQNANGIWLKSQGWFSMYTLLAPDRSGSWSQFDSQCGNKQCKVGPEKRQGNPSIKIRCVVFSDFHKLKAVGYWVVDRKWLTKLEVYKITLRGGMRLLLWAKLVLSTGAGHKILNCYSRASTLSSERLMATVSLCPGPVDSLFGYNCVQWFTPDRNHPP